MRRGCVGGGRGGPSAPLHRRRGEEVVDPRLGHQLGRPRVLVARRLDLGDRAAIPPSAWPLALDVASGSKLIAVAFANRLLRVIDYDHGMFQDFVGHSCPCTNVNFNADGTRLVSAGCEGIALWRVLL